MERHRLVVIVALGESIIAMGIGAMGLPLSLQLVVAALLGLTLVYQLWWCYFGRAQDVRAEHRLAAMSAPERARVALSAFGWAHAPILLGIVVVAVGVKKTIGRRLITSISAARSRWAGERRSSWSGWWSSAHGWGSGRSGGA